MTINNTTELQSIPPPWSSEFRGYFDQLKLWVHEKAFPALIQGPLNADPTVIGIPSELARLDDELARSRPIPIALVGLTGVGKSTLLNALLEQEFLPVGVIGAQTAAFVTISYAPQWEVTCDYVEEQELAAIFVDAAAEIDEENETGSPEDRERAQRKLRALLQLKDDAPLPLREQLRAGPPSDLLDLVRTKQRRFAEAEAWKEQLDLHAKGKLWPITKSIDVRGPFRMLESGIVISDLPGAGDLNRARVSQAAAAIKDAGQILIATDNRLLQSSLMDQLESAGRLPHRLFRSNQKVHVVLVGTSLDKGLPDPEDDAGQVKDLGLDPRTATTSDVFDAVCLGWAKAVLPQFTSWLRTKAVEFLPDVTEDERESRVEQILSNVTAVATSAKDWVRHKRNKKMVVCKNSERTGLPELRDSINALANHQIATTTASLRQKISELRKTVIESVERSEAAVGVDIEGILKAIERSQNRMKEVQERHTQIVDDLRLAVLQRFQQVRETLSDKIENASLKMRDLGRQQVQTHLTDLHWASLRATVNHQGFWVTRNGRQVNLRDAMGGAMTRLVPQAWSRIADERIGKQMEEAKDRVGKTLAAFTAEIRTVVDSEIADDVSRRIASRLFETSLERAASKIERSATAVTDLLGQTSKDMQQLVDDAVDSSLSGVCNHCCNDSGHGWRIRSVLAIVEGTSEVAEEARKRCNDIADGVFDKLDKAVVGFCKSATSEMAKIGENIPVVLRDAVSKARLTTPQAQNQALGNARRAVPEPLSDSMKAATSVG
jgi:flagellar biosynthesis GTPase FlhF